MNQVFPTTLVSRYFPNSSFDLVLGTLSIRELVNMHGSPLYLYDASILRNQYQAVKKALGNRVSILYALKANPNAAIAQVFQKLGAGAEVASAGEIHVALQAGFQGNDIHFSGPGKTRDDFNTASHTNIANINVDSQAELEALIRLCKAQEKHVNVSFRVQPSTGIGGSRMRMGGGQQKFGIPAIEMPNLLEIAKTSSWLNIQGLHTYAGTQCFDATAWSDHAAALIDLANSLEQQTSIELNSLNFGGGFGIGYYPNDPTFDLALAGARIQELTQQDQRPERRYYVELGRYLTAPAGVYACEVEYCKSSGEVQHLIVNGGMHHHAAAAGVGNVLKRAFPIVAAEKLKANLDHTYACSGNLCTPADEFSPKLDLPHMKAGDLVAILLSGAYGLTFSNTLFLSHPSPAEILVDHDHSWVIRKAGDNFQALALQQLPDHINSIHS